jgi:acylphosphatase
MMVNARARILVSGRVQGVFFRSNASKQARLRGLKGYVKNVQEGKVEVVFEGDRDRIEDMIDWCRHGPDYAFVEGVEVSWEKPKGEFKEFDIRY